MKFNCPSCSAKYQIPDEKLTGRVAKMKCRKCGTIIPIVAEPSGKSVAAAPIVPAMSLPPQMEAPVPPSIPAPVEPSEWHAGINGAPVGPMKRSEVAQRIADGEMTAETYVWREGMDGWKVIPEVAELASFLRDPSLLPPPSMPPQAKAQKAETSAVKLEAPRIIQPEPTAPLSQKPAKLSVSKAAAGSPQALAASFGLDIDSAHPPEIRERAASTSSGATDADSVAPAVTTEAPIPDIAMPSDDVPSSRGVASSRRPSMFSLRPSYESLVAELKDRKKHPWAVPFAVAGALVLGVTFGFVLFGDQKTKIIKQVVEVPAQAAESKAQSKDSGQAATTQDEEAQPEEAKVAAATTQKSNKTTGSSSTSGTSSSASSEKISKGLKGLDGLDGLNGPASGPSSGKGSSGGRPLEATQIQGTVSKYQTSVKRGCWQPALMSRDKNAPSTARVTVSIGVASTGQVTSASSSGDPKGYPGLSSCITSRVRGWRFPRSGGSTTVKVPFVFAAQ